MSTFVLERPARGACRVWLERRLQLPVLLSPLVKHRKRYGELYDWGKLESGCYLTAATLAYHCGVPADFAAWLAPALAEEILACCNEDVLRFDRVELQELVHGLIETMKLAYVDRITTARKWGVPYHA